MSRRSVTRGKAWERQVARDLSDATRSEFVRVLTEPRDGNSGDVVGPGVVVQAKAGKRPRIYDALREAVEAAGAGELPVGAINRMNGRGREAERFAVIPWEDFLNVADRLLRPEPDRPDPVLEREEEHDEWLAREGREVWGT